MDVDAIVSDCATCGSMIREYPKLFANDEQYLEKAKAVAAMMKDVSEFLAAIEFNDRLGDLKTTVTYHDPLPPGPVSEGQRPAAQAAQEHTGAGVQGSCRGRHVLWWRRILLPDPLRPV